MWGSFWELVKGSRSVYPLGAAAGCLLQPFITGLNRTWPHPQALMGLSSTASHSPSWTHLELLSLMETLRPVFNCHEHRDVVCGGSQIPFIGRFWGIFVQLPVSSMDAPSIPISGMLGRTLGNPVLP
jgi:hypothetical protein